jgi:hypothetical protein
MIKYANISPYMRRPLVIYDFATAPFRISLYMRKILFYFLSVYLTLQEPGDGVEPRRFVGQVERVVAQRLGGAGGGGTQAGAREAGPMRGQGCHGIGIKTYRFITYRVKTLSPPKKFRLKNMYDFIHVS